MEEYEFEGYAFETREQFNEARREKEAIDYLKAHMDATSSVAMSRLYNKLLDQKTLKTPLGMDYLRKLRAEIVALEPQADAQLRPVPQAQKRMTALTETEVKRATGEANRKIYELNSEKRRWKIATFVLAIIVIGMFAISLSGYYSPFRDYEKAVQDEYGAWGDRLRTQEEKLKDREAQLDEKEKTLTEWEARLQERLDMSNSDN